MKASFISLALVFAALALAPGRSHASPGWELVLDRPTPNFGGIDFTSANDGWITAGAGLLRTTDGGATWSEAAKLSGNDVDFADEQHGWLVGGGGSIYATSDGATWHPQDSGTSVHLHDVVALSATEAWAVGFGEGDVVPPQPPSAFLHTTDGGQTWRQIDVPANSYFYQIAFVGQTGWAMGYSCEEPINGPYCARGGPVQSILRTIDGGATWSLIPNVPVRTELTFVSETEGWALGELPEVPQYSAVYHTVDGGTTWEAQLHGSESEPFSYLAFKDPMKGWLVSSRYGPDGSTIVVRRTTDGGMTWHRVAEIAASSRQIPQNVTIEGSTLYLTGTGGLALRSADDGGTWQQMETPAMTLAAVDFVDARRGFGLSDNRFVATDDAGQTWRRLDAEFPPFVTEYESPAKLAFFDASRGMVASENCRASCMLDLSLTTDGGRTWSVVDSRPESEVAPVMRVEVAGDAALIIGAQGLLLTSDRGATWQFRDVPTDVGMSITDAEIVDATHLWATVIGQPDGQSKLLRSDDGGLTWDVLLSEPHQYYGLVRFVDFDHGWYAGGQKCTDNCGASLFATTDGGAAWRETTQSGPSDLVFADQANGWGIFATCQMICTRPEIWHSADGGRTWTSQLSALLFGSLDFVDAKNGWFLPIHANDPYSGGGPAQRTLLYHTSDGGGGPIGIGPTPTISFPDVGIATPGGGGPWQLGLALAALGALAIGGALATRRR